MKKLIRYFSKIHRIVALFNFIFFGFIAYWTFINSNNNQPVIENIASVLYSILVVLAIISIIMRIRNASYLDTIEQYVNKHAAIQKDNITSYLEFIEQLHADRGIVGVKERANFTEIVEHISNAKNSIKIIFYYGNRFLQQTDNELINAINNRDVMVQLIFAGGNSPLLKEVWELEYDGRKERRWTDSLEIIKKIEEQTNNKKGKFAYHPCNTQIRYSLILIDNKWAWWTPYHPGVDVAETTSFILDNKGDNPILEHCKSHFDKLWFYLVQKQKNNPNDTEQQNKEKQA